MDVLAPVGGVAAALFLSQSVPFQNFFGGLPPYRLPVEKVVRRGNRESGLHNTIPGRINPPARAKKALQKAMFCTYVSDLLHFRAHLAARNRSFRVPDRRSDPWSRARIRGAISSSSLGPDGTRTLDCHDPFALVNHVGYPAIRGPRPRPIASELQPGGSAG